MTEHVYPHNFKEDGVELGDRGLSLRDRIAIETLVALIREFSRIDSESLSEVAYDIADAMMKQRSVDNG